MFFRLTRNDLEQEGSHVWSLTWCVLPSTVGVVTALSWILYMFYSLALGYQLGIKWKCWKTRDNVCFGLFPILSGCCVFAWHFKACAYENCANNWKLLSVFDDCCTLLKGFCVLIWTNVSDEQSDISVGETNFIRWCRLSTDRGDCLCDRQFVGFDGVCKLRWGDLFESFCFLWTPSYVMAQMWRDRMWCRFVLGVCLIKKVLMYVIYASLCSW